MYACLMCHWNSANWRFFRWWHSSLIPTKLSGFLFPWRPKWPKREGQILSYKTLTAQHWDVCQTSIPLCMLWKEALFCSGGFELVSYMFLFLFRYVLKMWLISYNSFILLCCWTKERIYESVNLKGVVYKAKQSCFSLQSVTTCTGFANIGEIFYKVHSLTSKQVFNWIEQKTCSVFGELILLL